MLPELRHETISLKKGATKTFLTLSEIHYYFRTFALRKMKKVYVSK